ncbi:response regulator, partial [Legionella feeleii]
SILMEEGGCMDSKENMEKQLGADHDENMEEGPGLYEQYQELPANHYGFFKGLNQKPCNVPSTHNRLTIAIVDDEAFTLDIGKKFVDGVKKQQQDYVISATLYQFPQDIPQFKSDLERGYINGILTDHDMPVMTGSELIQYVRQATKNANINNIPILLNSAATTPNQKMLTDYEVQFAEKPITAMNVKSQLVEPVINYDRELKAQNSLKH